MIAMWVIPLGLSIKYFYIRFIIIWCCFTMITVYITRRATRQPIEPNTPRLVYKWFLLVYKVSYGCAIGGYLLIMMTFLGINNLLLISPQVNI
jgi:RING finger protein 121